MSGNEKVVADFATLDLDRLKRRGVGEVIFGEGKEAEEIALIMEALIERQGRALTTRVSPEIYKAIMEIDDEERLAGRSQWQYDDRARCLFFEREPAQPVGRGIVLILTAGTSDGAVATEADVVLKFLGHTTQRIHDVGVAGLHRILSHLDTLRSAEVIITCAGMEGALPSVVAGLVDCPVIAVPTSVGYGANLGGVTALLGMLNSCAAGVVVVNIDNGFGAAYAAAQMNRERLGV